MTLASKAKDRGTRLESDPNFFQTISFTGLSIVPGDTFAWAGLDFDLIVSVSPLTLSSGPLCTSSGCAVSTSLDNALFSVFFSDGKEASAMFTSGNIFLTHIFTLVPDAVSIPEPATFALFGIGLAGLGVMSRRRRKRADAA